MKRSFTAFLIIISLLSALAGSCFEIELNIDKKEVGLEESQKSAETTNQSLIKLDHFHAIVQLAQLVFLQEFNFKIEMPTREELKPDTTIDASLTFIKYYRTLFRKIISPNAP